MRLKSRNSRARSTVSCAATSRITMEPCEGRVLLSTYTVTNTNDSGAGSLRQAILDANKTTAADTIKFSIGSGAKTISPKSNLPSISQPTLLDATSQPGFSGKPLIELSGSNAGSSADGLKLTGSGVTVKGLIVNRFHGSGIFIYSKGGDKIVGCYIGTDKTGTSAAGNSAHGIIVQSPNNIIGGTSPADRNVISANGNAGVFLYTSAASHNSILGNYIGADATGTKALGNTNAGVQVNGGAYNTIGGTAAGSRNIISGNKKDGVLMVTGGSQHNTVAGNYIGTNAAGAARLGNGWYGVEISQPNNTVGGNTSAARNVISANGYSGVVFYLSTATGNTVLGNYIGTDSTGTKSLGNIGTGVDITNGASNNTVGGSTAASRNIIAGNDMSGVGIYNSSSKNTVSNNYIGICATGYLLANAKSGILVVSSSNNIFSSNKIACIGTYNPLQINSGSNGNDAASNSLWAKVSLGLKVV